MKEWQEFVSELEHELGSNTIQEWMPKVTRFDAGNIYLEAKDSFQISWFNEHIKPRLKGFHNYNQRPIKIHLETIKKNVAKVETFQKKFEINSDPIDPEMSLENFINIENNCVISKLLEETASANPIYNPIFIFGPKGAGKTHLLIGAALLCKKNGKRVFYVKAETFTEHVIQAIRLSQMRDFRKIYRNIDLLIIDDIQDFAKKWATQEEFFHTFNTLHTEGKQIIISSNTSPMKLTEIEPRLISRFEWGISLPLEKTEPSLLLDMKAKIWNMPLNKDLKEFLLKKCPQDPIMALQALHVRSKGENVSLLVAEKLIKDLIQIEEKVILTPDMIITKTANHYGITSDDILGKSQMKEFAFPRQVAMYLCRKHLKIPFQKLGEIFGRDHSTVMSSFKQIEKAADEKKFNPDSIFI